MKTHLCVPAKMLAEGGIVRKVLRISSVVVLPGHARGGGGGPPQLVLCGVSSLRCRIRRARRGLAPDPRLSLSGTLLEAPELVEPPVPPPGPLLLPTCSPGDGEHTRQASRKVTGSDAAEARKGRNRRRLAPMISAPHALPRNAQKSRQNWSRCFVPFRTSCQERLVSFPDALEPHVCIGAPVHVRMMPAIKRGEREERRGCLVIHLWTLNFTQTV